MVALPVLWETGRGDDGGELDEMVAMAGQRRCPYKRAGVQPL